MNFTMQSLPSRSSKKRDTGMTMVMDTGLSVRQVEDMLEIAGDYIDIVKFGWATAYVSQDLEEKLAVYRSADIPVYFGGTLFEAMLVRNDLEHYKRILQKYKIEHVEISDGSINIDHGLKCEHIRDFAKDFCVISEVGSKDEENIMPPYQWIELMEAEKAAGSFKLIAEARESGNVGIYRGSGEVRQGLVKEIVTKIPVEDVIWETPQKEQQIWFVKLFGANVNLGNIRPDNVISLETIRLGLRSDTFHCYLEKKDG